MDNLSKYNPEGSQTRNIQLRELELLCAVDDICRRHSINYWIDFGTLLGAVRHKGFIPWDDDIDITMTEEDHKKFVEIAPKELTGQFYLQTPETEPSYFKAYNKVRDRNSFAVSKYDDFSRDYGKGISMDIFRAERHANVNKGLLNFVMKTNYKYKSLYGAQHFLTRRIKAAIIILPITATFANALWGLASLKPKTKIGYERGHYPKGIAYDIDDLFPLTEIEFEGRKFLAPHNPDRYLKEIYGDYMQLPPEEDRQTHYVFAQTW